MEKNLQHPEKNNDKNDHSHHFAKHDLEHLFPHIENGDINLQIGCVKIIVFKNCTSIYIEGKSTKIYFDIPSIQYPVSQVHFNEVIVRDKESIQTAHNELHEPDDNAIIEHKNAREHNHEHSEKQENQKEEGEQKVHKHTHEHPQKIIEHNHNHDHNHDDEIDLSCEGVKILLCDCCSVLKIKTSDTDIKLPLDNFKKTNLVLTNENGFQITRYKIEFWKHTTNERDQRLYINSKRINFEYDPGTKLFHSHLFFEGYSSIYDFMADFIKANPELKEIKHNH